MNEEILIEVEGVSRDYGSHRAVDNLTFQLARGEVLGLLGPNGAGKSTTLQMVSGNLAPSSGRIRINGIDLLEQPKRAKLELGYLPEQPPLYRELTVDEYLRYCARLNRIARNRIESAVATSKERCGLTDVGRRLIGNLSKGYQQRVGIAQAIIHTPAVVILDEPTVGLDPIQIREIRELIRELGRDHGVILSTHILPEVVASCSRVQIIHQGRLLFSDTMHGLEERLSEPTLLLRFDNPPPPEAIAAITHVTEVVPQADGRLLVRHAEGTHPAAAIAEMAVREGWGVRELTPHQRTLEQLFVELTTHHPGEAA